MLNNQIVESALWLYWFPFSVMSPDSIWMVLFWVSVCIPCRIRRYCPQTETTNVGNVFFHSIFDQKSFQIKNQQTQIIDKDFKSFYDDIRYLNRIIFSTKNINFRIKISIPIEWAIEFSDFLNTVELTDTHLKAKVMRSSNLRSIFTRNGSIAATNW